MELALLRSRSGHHAAGAVARAVGQGPHRAALDGRNRGTATRRTVRAGKRGRGLGPLRHHLSMLRPDMSRRMGDGLCLAPQVLPRPEISETRHTQHSGLLPDRSCRNEDLRARTADHLWNETNAPGQASLGSRAHRGANVAAPAAPYMDRAAAPCIKSAWLVRVTSLLRRGRRLSRALGACGGMTHQSTRRMATDSRRVRREQTAAHADGRAES